MEQEEWLLERTLRDLEAAVRSTDEYELLQAAGLVRKLLIDGSNLVDQVNRLHRLRITFRVAGHDDDFIRRTQQVLFWSTLDGLDPEKAVPSPSRQIHDLNRDQFLAFQVARAGTVDYSVHNIIDLVANKMGGVHLDRSLEGKQRVLVELLASFQLLVHFLRSMPVFGLRPTSPLFFVCIGVRGISSVVLRALEPLRAAIRAGGAK